jgi:hypothetical protein
MRQNDTILYTLTSTKSGLDTGVHFSMQKAQTMLNKTG